MHLSALSAAIRASAALLSRSRGPHAAGRTAPFATPEQVAQLSKLSGILTIRLPVCAGLCRTTAHYVVGATTDAQNVIRGIGKYSLDGGTTYLPGTAMVREAKPQANQKGTVSQSINWG